jgi:hypothetical protein
MTTAAPTSPERYVRRQRPMMWTVIGAALVIALLAAALFFLRGHPAEAPEGDGPRPAAPTAPGGGAAP